MMMRLGPRRDRHTFACSSSLKRKGDHDGQGCRHIVVVVLLGRTSLSVPVLRDLEAEAVFLLLLGDRVGVGVVHRGMVIESYRSMRRVYGERDGFASDMTSPFIIREWE
jgi:hypothetical protein